MRTSRESLVRALVKKCGRSVRSVPRGLGPLVSAIVIGLAVATCARDVTELSEPPKHSKAPGNAPGALPNLDHPERIPGEYLVLFSASVTDPHAAARQLVTKNRGNIVEVWEGLNGVWLRLPSVAVPGLQRSPMIRSIEPNLRLSTSTTVQPITSPDGNWGLDRIDQVDNPKNDSYAYDFVGSGVHLWIVDSGVDTAFVEIGSRVDTSLFYAMSGTDPFIPCETHGSHVAILAAGSIHGVAKGAMIHVARVADDGYDCSHGTMNLGASISAFNFIGNSTARPAVANYSAVLHSTSIALNNAVQYAITKGVQVTVSAGNDGANACEYSPANVVDAITVGATDMTDYRVVRWNEPASWASNYGACLDLFAPGYNMAVGCCGNIFYGTSAAAPLVAGVAALYLEQVPSASPAAVRQWIIGNANNATLLNTGSGSPNRLLHSRPAVPAPVFTTLTTNPSPARQYQPFTLTITGSGFDPATVEILVGPAGCGWNYEASCVAIYENSSLATKTPTQVVIQNAVLSMAGTKDVYVRNGRNGLLAGPMQFTVTPL